MKETPRNLAASVHARLLNRSRVKGEDFNFNLQRYASERFLFRLGESPHRDRLVLKGAMLFSLWGGSLYRSTRDLDFTGYGPNNEKQVLACLAEICNLAVPDDGMTFDTSTLTAEPIREHAEYNGLRIRLTAYLGNARIPMQIDIGFGNAIEPAPSEVQYPVLLDAASPRILAYPKEAVVAEKFHALVTLGEATSRTKDLYDLYVLAGQFDFQGDALARAIRATFERRKTAITVEPPAALTPQFFADEDRGRMWNAYRERNTLSGAPQDLQQVGERLRAFLTAPWVALASADRVPRHWPQAGPWKFGAET